MDFSSIIRGMIPASASSAEAKMYTRLLQDAMKRDTHLDKQLLMHADRRFNGDQVQALASPLGQIIEHQQRPLGMARTNLQNAELANLYNDPTLEMLLATTPNAKSHAASLVYSPPSYHAGVKGLPENSVYIQGLASEARDGGTAMLKELEKRYPNSAMHLQSLDLPETKAFYLNKGFLPYPDKSSPAIERNLWIKSADTPVRAAAVAPLAASSSVTEPSTWDNIKSKLPDAVSGFLNQFKDPLSLPAMGMAASGEAYKHGGLARCSCGRS